MNIAILGNGKMGKEVSIIAKERGHVITCVSSSKEPIHNLNLKNTDLAIEFSTPSTAFENITYALEKNIPIVSGTTGWEHKFKEIQQICKLYNGAFLYSSNFSIGMNIFFEINRKIAHLIKKQHCKIIINETHHKTKKDSPSGTAKTLANDIDSILNFFPLIKSKRIKDAIGQHSVIFDLEYESINIQHISNNRKTFAIGAIIAAEWLIGKTGFYTMKDVLNTTELNYD